MPVPHPPSQARTLRRLFLTLLLRGRTSRGLRKKTAPDSVGAKLWLVLVIYALVGLTALAFKKQSVLVLSALLHGLTLTILGLYVAASAGEVLFNREEADILMHRPVTPQALLWAKVSMLVTVSLWLAVAVNLCGFFIGVTAPGGGWSFLLAHAASTGLGPLLCGLGRADLPALLAVLRARAPRRVDDHQPGAKSSVTDNSREELGKNSVTDNSG